MRKTLLIELHYLPLVSYFSLLKQYDEVLIEAHEHFQKQTLRNRTYILSANGELLLTVPVQHDAKTVQEVKIDYSHTWLKNHLRGITSAYKHSPYFDYYFPYFEEVYTSKPVFLFDLNKQFIDLVIRVLKLPIRVGMTSVYEDEYPSDVTDYRSKMQYREMKEAKKYTQVFGEHFMPDLSMLDLIFNCGPDSLRYL